MDNLEVDSEVDTVDSVKVDALEVSAGMVDSDKVDALEVSAAMVDSAAKVDSAATVDSAAKEDSEEFAHREVPPVAATGARPQRDKITAAKTTPSLPRTQ